MSKVEGRPDTYSQLVEPTEQLKPRPASEGKFSSKALAWTAICLLGLVLVLQSVQINSQNEKLSHLENMIQTLAQDQKIAHIEATSLLRVQSVESQLESSAAKQKINEFLKYQTFEKGQTVSLVNVPGQDDLQDASPKFMCTLKSPIHQYGDDNEMANVLSAQNLTGGWQGAIEKMDSYVDIKKTPGPVTYGTVSNNDYTYTGELINNIPSGYGRQTYFSTNNVYEGQFKSGKCNGFVLALYNDGTSYVGMWSNDQKTKGTTYDKNGCVSSTIG